MSEHLIGETVVFAGRGSFTRSGNRPGRIKESGTVNVVTSFAGRFFCHSTIWLLRCGKYAISAFARSSLFKNGLAGRGADWGIFGSQTGCAGLTATFGYKAMRNNVCRLHAAVRHIYELKFPFSKRTLVRGVRLENGKYPTLRPFLKQT